MAGAEQKILRGYARRSVQIVNGELGINAKGRRISGTDEESGLRQSQAFYSNDFEAKNGLKNEWRVHRKSKRK